MSLLTSRTQLEIDLANNDESVTKAGRAIHHAALVLSNEYKAFWALPTDRLLALLNHNVPRSLAVFAANTTAGTSLNSILDLLGDPALHIRVPVEPARTDITFDQGTMQFVYTPPVEEEPEDE